MHKDQQRVVEKLLPHLVSLTESEEGVRDCTILNRALIQGPDPLFLMVTCPKLFTALCGELGLSLEEGTWAIESAHWQGPAVLLEGVGLSVESRQKARADLPLKLRQEALWLVLASVSNCTEEGYKAEVSLVDRFVRLNEAVARLESKLTGFVEFCRSPVESALFEMAKFERDLPVFLDSRGIPHTNVDHGFYVLYKQGYKAVACHTSGPTFYGTSPDTSLEENGIKVDKVISPQFGLVFEDSAAAFENLKTVTQ